MNSERREIASFLVHLGMIVAILGMYVVGVHIWMQGRDPFGEAEKRCNHLVPSHLADSPERWECIRAEENVTAVERGLRFLPIPAIGAATIALGRRLGRRRAQRFASPTGALLVVAALHLETWLLMWPFIEVRGAGLQGLGMLASSSVLFLFALRSHANGLRGTRDPFLRRRVLLHASLAVVMGALLLEVPLLLLSPLTAAAFWLTPAASVAVPGLIRAATLSLSLRGSARDLGDGGISRSGRLRR